MPEKEDLASIYLTEDEKKAAKKAKILFIVGLVALIVLMVIGLGILILGILLYAGASLWTKQNKDVLDFIPKIVDLAQITVAQVWTQDDLDGIQLDTSELTRQMSFSLCGLGVALMVISPCGIFSFKKPGRCLCIIFGILTGLIVVMQLAAVISLWVGQVAPLVKTSVKNTLANYAGVDAKDATSVAWNFFMIKFECCGVDNHEDFTDHRIWQSNRTFLVGNENMTKILFTPLACCKFEGTYPDEADFVRMDGCAFKLTFDEATSNYERGCWEAVGNFLSQHKVPALVGTVLGVVIQIAAYIVAIVMLALKKKGEKKPKVEDSYQTKGGGKSRKGKKKSKK